MKGVSVKLRHIVVHSGPGRGSWTQIIGELSVAALAVAAGQHSIFRASAVSIVSGMNICMCVHTHIYIYIYDVIHAGLAVAAGRAYIRNHVVDGGPGCSSWAHMVDMSSVA